jgi:subtilisin family serine protease
MAPGAVWIGCRNMNNGFGTPATYLECFEWFLAPYALGDEPADGNPALAPDVTNNSWGCPPSEGCAVATLQAAVDAQRAAGIFTVVSAGNKGSGCSTVVDPPAFYDGAYTVGALNTGFDTIATISSRGPVTVDGSGRLKPDIAAPGTSIRSSVPGNGYGNLTGTSMAVPHVVGAVALLWSARPDLRGEIELTEDLINQTAYHINTSACFSSAWPNNVYGFGRLDVRATVNRALAQAFFPIIVR